MDKGTRNAMVVDPCESVTNAMVGLKRVIPMPVVGRVFNPVIVRVTYLVCDYIYICGVSMEDVGGVRWVPRSVCSPSVCALMYS